MAETWHATGVLKGPDNLYENATAGSFNSIDGLLPATKSELRTADRKLETQLDAANKSNLQLKTEISEYKNETTAVIQDLVDKVKALTPVGSLLSQTA